MTDTKTVMPEALRLADWCDANSSGDYRQSAEAAAELRRLHARVQELEAQAKRDRDALVFVERWVVHHASKECFTKANLLSCIQHHPVIKEITSSYADGRPPETFDPFARIAELEQMLLKEVQHSANEKQRADRMSEQHDMQAALNRDAREQLAQQSPRKPLTNEQIDALWGGGDAISIPQRVNRRAIARSVERAHNITS